MKLLKKRLTASVLCTPDIWPKRRHPWRAAHQQMLCMSRSGNGLACWMLSCILMSPYEKAWAIWYVYFMDLNLIHNITLFFDNSLFWAGLNLGAFLLLLSHLPYMPPVTLLPCCSFWLPHTQLSPGLSSHSLSTAVHNEQLYIKSSGGNPPEETLYFFRVTSVVFTVQ